MSRLPDDLRRLPVASARQSRDGGGPHDPFAVGRHGELSRVGPDR